MRSLTAVSLALLLGICCLGLAVGQLSNPISSDAHVSVDGNKFLQRHAEGQLTTGQRQRPSDEAAGAECPQNIQMKWMAEASSSVYSTPVITDLFSDGMKDIVVSSFVHYLEVLQADNGAKSAGFPAFHASKVHASPLMHDIDQDGIQDILVATYNGEILFYKDNGEQMPIKMAVPRLTVKRDWYRPPGADSGSHRASPTPTDDAAAGDVHDIHHEKPIELEHLQQQVKDLHEQVAGNQGQRDAQSPDSQGPSHEAASPERSAGAGEPPVRAEREASPQAQAGGGAENAAKSQQQLNPEQAQQQREVAQQAGTQASETLAGDATPHANPEEQHPTHARRQLLQAAAGGDGQQPAEAGVEADPEGPLSKEALDAQDVAPYEDADADPYNLDLEDYDLHGYHHHYDAHPWTGDARLRDEALPVLHDNDVGDYDDADRRGTLHQDDPDWGWADDEFDDVVPHAAGAVYLNVDVDPHIMCTPALGDIDGDDHTELVVAVSYLFDQSFYDDPAHAHDLDAAVDKTMYVASGIVVFDLVTRAVKWSRHLDLTTDHVNFRAYMYSSPTLVDLDRNGKLQTVVGTSVGFLYVLDSDGNPRPGFPVQMGEIQGQVSAADVNGDGYLELFAVDTRGNAAMFDRHGKLLWDRHLGFAMSQSGTFGDVNGDGMLDIAVGTGGGQLWALSAATGETLPGFPFNTTGRLVAPVLITRLSDTPSQQMVVMCFDGFLYVVDGLSGCADVVDIGEASYAMVLADDLDNNGRMDLVVSTMNGHVFAFETPAEYHPLKAWTKQPEGTSLFVARHDWAGIYATELTRRPIDIRGTSFPVEFRIIDKAPTAGEGTGSPPPLEGAPVAEVKRLGAPYAVRVLLKGISADAMNYGNQPVIIGMSDTFQAPGKYTLEIPCPRSRSTATIHLEMTDGNGITYVDTFPQSFHMHFYKLLKWMIAGPLLAMGLFVLVLKPENAVMLPS